MALLPNVSEVERVYPSRSKLKGTEAWICIDLPAKLNDMRNKLLANGKELRDSGSVQLIRLKQKGATLWVEYKSDSESQWEKVSIDEQTRLLPRNQIDILGVCETFSYAMKHNVKIQGYNFIEKIRQNHGKGDLGLFLKEGVHFKHLPDLGKYDFEKLCEILAVECRAGTKNFQICVVYKPPSAPIPLFLQSLESLLASLDDKQVVVMGDFNLNLRKYDENTQTTEFITLMTSKSLTPSCAIPTRVSLTSATLFDNIFLTTPATSSQRNLEESTFIATDLIVNIKVFTNSDVPTREGSKIDDLHLRSLFEGLKFTVVVKNDIKADKEKKDQEIQAECTASSHAMEEVEDALEVHEKEFSQPLVLDKIDVEIFNKITAAMVITNQDTKPADLPTSLAEMLITEATEHDRLGSLLMLVTPVKQQLSHRWSLALRPVLDEKEPKMEKKSPVPPLLEKNAPSLKHLHSSPTIQFMFDNFVKKNPDFITSVESYRRILKTMNISLRIPVADACPTCERLSERNNNDDVNDEEPGQEKDTSWRGKWLLHIYMFGKATQKYQEDASENDSPDKRVYAVDLQKVILLSEKGVNTITMDTSFKNWTSKKIACTKKVKLSHLNAIVEAEFRKGSRNMFYRTSFDSDEVLLSDCQQVIQSLMSYNQYDASHFSQHGKWQPQHLVVHVPVNNSNGQLSAVSISGYNLPVNNRFQVLENNNGFPSLTTDSDEARLSVYLMLAEGIIDSSENEKTRFPRSCTSYRRKKQHDPDSEGDVRAIWKINHIHNQSNEEHYNVPFTIVELNSVNSLPTTTPGNNGIYCHFIKNLSESWVATLLNIINHQWFHNEFPEIWKEGVAVMLP
ncbi:hypothetical protein QYM36_006516, partial [Artemia franciscana]